MKLATLASALILICSTGTLIAQKSKNDGLNPTLGNIFLLSDAKTRSISPENFTGEPGKGGMAELGNSTGSHAARDLGQEWKVSPSVKIEAGQTFILAEITDSG
ncbi:hypothetical protein [Winogradskyella schleiferi]|uniref:hypothetical protein n=1 Tax=Winogradskyella schleiferi TaxID=2686078 RepID=UPI001E6123CB|nr:hypothetical protein [Winogradskyella schleiferi]